MILPKKHLRNLTRTPITPENRIGKIFRFDRNERTTPFPEEHLKAILKIVTPEELVAYPEIEPFYRKLANWLKLERDEILVASGSDTNIKMVFETYIDEGDEVVIISPTYAMYLVYSQMFGATAREVFYNGDFTLKTEDVENLINPKTKLVVISNPNHTGTVIDQNDLIQIIRKARNFNSLVLIDEAYYHFYPNSLLGKIRDFENLIIIRTFSKSFGIAALRVGYTISNRENIKNLYKVKQTHDITFFSAKVAEYLLDHLEIMEDYVRDVKLGKTVLFNRLPYLGFEILKSETNFVFVKPPLGIDEKKLMAGLAERKFAIKGPFSQIPFCRHLRVTVGTPEQMEMLCDEIGSWLKKQGKLQEAN